MKLRLASIAAAACLTGYTAVLAQTADPVEQYNSNALWFENWINLSNATLKVTAPNGKVTELFTASGTPVFKLASRDAMDGIYRYEMFAATDEKVDLINQIDNGRGENQGSTANKPYYLAGFFTVSRGVIVKPEEIKEE